jgi:hypothetical protein
MRVGGTGSSGSFRGGRALGGSSSGSGSGSSGGGGGGGVGSRGTVTLPTWLLIIIVAGTLALWLFSIRMTLTAHNTIQSSVVSSKENQLHSLQNVRHIQSLLDETGTLLSDLKKSKSSTDVRSPDSKTGGAIDVLRKEQSLALEIEADLLRLQSELHTTEDKYAMCIQEAYNEKLKLEKCELRSPTVASAGAVVPVDTVAARNGAAASAPTRPWLVIGIPTVSRPHNEDYLIKYDGGSLQ